MAGRQSPPTVIAFDPEEPAVVVEHLERLRRAGQGWVNLEPEVPEDSARLHQGGNLFSNRGPAVPLCTWTAPHRDRRGRWGPIAMGVQHATGGRARARLDQVRLEIPAGWAVRADHPKRGLVVELDADSELAMALDWLLATGEALATVALSGRWHASVHRG